MRSHSFGPKRLFLVGITFAGILAMLVGSWSCSPKGYSGQAESITIGTTSWAGTIPIFVAQDQGFFTENGLNVTIKNYDTALQSLDALSAGEIEIVTSVTDFGAVSAVFRNQPVEIIGCMSKTDNEVLIGRTDRGIRVSSDLKGKKVGVLKGTILEFYMSRFLELQRVNVGDVTLVDVGTPQKSVDALVSGTVDAGVFGPPYDKLATDSLGNDSVIIPIQSSQYLYTLLASDSEWLKLHANLAERFLKALEQSEEFINQKPQQAKMIEQKVLNMTDESVTRSWSQSEFSLSLDQALVTAMEDEARWMISDNLTSQKQVPDFDNYLYADALKKIEPDAVNLIR